MDRICLDKTIALSRDIMNEKAQLPENVQVQTILGAKYSFNFQGSDVLLPIDHIGLAVLSYEATKEGFTVTRREPDGSETKDYEPIQHEQGIYLSDFVSSISPNTLNWYKRTNGEEMHLTYVGSNVIREQTQGYEQCKSLGENGEDYRVMAITEGFKAGLNEYCAETIAENINQGNNENLTYPLSITCKEEMQNFLDLMGDLYIKSAHCLPNQDSAMQETAMEQ